MNRCCSLLGFLLVCSISFGQPPAPNGDLNWNTTTLCLNDEFTTFDSNTWVKLTTPEYQWGQEVFQPSKVVIDATGGPTNSGVLNLNMEKVGSNGIYTYYSGGITTGNHAAQRGFNYPFGYYEISAKLPYGKGLWPAFWIFGSDPYGLLCDNVRRTEEIDIMENPDMGEPSSQPDWGDDYLGYNWHYQYPLPPCTLVYHKSDNGSNGLFPAEYNLPGSNMTTSYHKFALEWLPGIMVFYFDDEPLVEALYQDMIPQDNRKEVLLTHQVQKNFFGTSYNIYGPDSDGKVTPNTATFSIDYVRVFELKNTPAEIINVSINSQSELNTFNYSLKKSITIGSSGGMAVFSGEKKTLRATDGIVLNGDFEVALGGTFTAVVHNSPPPRGPAY